MKGDYGRIKESSKRLNDHSVLITKEVMAVADELGISAANVALQWTRQQGIKTIPIVGATKLAQLEENLKITSLQLPKETIERLNTVSQIELGFPGDFFAEEGVKKNNFGGFYDRIMK